jgi:hypothetical protein
MHTLRAMSNPMYNHGVTVTQVPFKTRQYAHHNADSDVLSLQTQPEDCIAACVQAMQLQSL